MQSVLFVCTGNICRSPTAEAICKNLADSKGIEIHAESAGLESYHVGEPPDRRTIAVARHNNIDMSELRARAFRTSDFNDFDYILAMDSGHYRRLKALKPKECRAEIFMFLSFSGDGQSSHDVPDPYYGSVREFEDVFCLIERGTIDFLNYYGKQA